MIGFSTAEFRFSPRKYASIENQGWAPICMCKADFIRLNKTTIVTAYQLESNSAWMNDLSRSCKACERWIYKLISVNASAYSFVLVCNVLGRRISMAWKNKFAEESEA